MNSRSQPISMPFPVRGVDQSQAYSAQPPGTCPDLRNVRVSDSRNRNGGGKRDGHIRALTTTAGAGLSSQRVTGLAIMSQARGAPSGAGGTVVQVSQPFTGLGVATEVNTASVANGTDLVYFNHTALSAGSTRFFSGVNCVASAISGACLAIDGVFDLSTTGKQAARGVAIDYFTTNDITVTVETIKAIAFLDVVGNDRARWGPVNEPCGVGPFIRGAILLNQMVMARLLPTSANNFRLQIINVGSNDPPVVLAQSAITNLPVTTGAATQYTLRLVESSAGLQAILNWPDESIVNLTVTAAGDTTYLGNYRGGVINCTDSSPGGVNCGITVTTSWRKIKQIDYAKRVPSSYQVYKTVDASDVQYNTANFTLPSLFRSFRLSGGVATVQNGLQTFAVIQNFATVDSTNDIVTIAASAGEYGMVDQNPDSGSGPVDVRPGVDVLPTPDFRSDTQKSWAAGMFRVADDSRTFVYIGGDFSSLPSNASGAVASATINTGVIDFLVSNVVVSQYLNGSASLSAGPNLTTHHMPMRETDRLRFTDDGTTLRIYLNGMLLLSHTPASFVGTGRRCGCHNLGSPATAWRIKAARVVQGETAASVDLSEVDPKVLVITQGRFEIGDIIGDTLSPVSGVGSFLGALPQATGFNNKFYCVDGTTAGGIGGGVIVDPTTLISSDWVATAGTAPWDDATIGPARLVATYRGRTVLARFQQNATLWCMTRVAAPTDFDYGASPTQTAAVIGTNAKVGMPSDAITALVPIADDYLLFMCINSVWMLEGDPGYGGKIQNLTQQGGCFGPRAYCFGTDGTLYWVGPGGLFRLPRGSQAPEQLEAGRLQQYIEQADTSSQLVQMAFDHLLGEMHIFLTPTNGTSIGVHVVYNPASGAMWLDSYPLAMGPWSVCQLSGNTDDYRRYLIGGNDGYLRRPSGLVQSDDGNAIDSYVRHAPIESENGMSENILTELQFQLAPDSGDVTWEVLTAKTAAAIAELAVGSGTLTGTLTAGTDGFCTPVRARLRAGCHQLVLRQNSATLTWQMERAVAYLGAAGRRR